MPVTDVSNFICPACQLPLKETRTSHGFFWSCENCGGRAVTIELLRRTFTPECINPLWLHVIRGEGTRGRPCPECRQPMLAVPLSDDAGVAVDLCKHCHFVWFDAGEVDTLKPRPLPPAEPELPQEARELLAMEKVRQLAEEARGSDFDSAPPDEQWKTIAGFFGCPVEFDAPEAQRRPWVTWSLAAAIVAVSLSALPQLRGVVQHLGLIPAQATRLYGFTFVTSFFLHAGVVHLIGNMYFLVVFGDNVENFLRPWRYLALIALAAFIGDLAHIMADPRSQIPCVGASGGIAGVITFYALAFPHVRLGLLMRWGFVWFRWVRFPAWFGLVLWILLQLVGAWAQKAGISAVSAFAHLGGAAVGVIAWLIWRNQTPNDSNV
jgi:membrane associated rhomboid family serine protease/Zn-finger nucleic acid-binding protein